MTKLPGNILAADKSKLTCSILYELGVVLALMHEALQECDSEYLETDPENPWCLENLHLLTDYLPCIQDQEERKVLSSIIEKFLQIRVNTFHLLQKGIIHGDFHDWNLIVEWQDSPTPCDISESATSTTRSDISDTTRSDISDTTRSDTSDTLTSTTQVPSATSTTSPTTTNTSNSTTTTDITSTTMNISINTIKQKYGIIDFEEMSFSYPVLELCRLVADMMVDCTVVDLLEIGGHVIAGYTSVKGEPVKLFSTCFYDTVLACLAQYVVLQNYEYQAQAGDNDYCLEGADGAKVVINKLKGVTSCDLYKKWVGVLNSYGLTDVF